MVKKRNGESVKLESRGRTQEAEKREEIKS